jgi:hypothetical protein
MLTMHRSGLVFTYDEQPVFERDNVPVVLGGDKQVLGFVCQWNESTTHPTLGWTVESL